jgi:putative flippase GtrA
MMILKFIKFCAVGLSGMLIDFDVTFLLKEKVRINVYLANSCGFILAAWSNYALNRIWTFESANSQIAGEYSSFIVIALIGLGINNLVIWALSGKLRFNFYVAKLIATGVVTVWNFTMNFMFTFSST